MGGLVGAGAMLTEHEPGIPAGETPPSTASAGRVNGKASVQAGDNIWVKADVLMTHDVCGPGTIGVFKREFGKDAKVWDKQRVVIIPDHYIFTADSKSNRNVDILREFVPRAGVALLLRRHRRSERARGNSMRPRAMLEAPVRFELRGRLPRGAAGRKATRGRAKFVRHGFAHLHGGRVQ
jgi:hypothetical protein